MKSGMLLKSFSIAIAVLAPTAGLIGCGFGSTETVADERDRLPDEYRIVAQALAMPLLASREQRPVESNPSATILELDKVAMDLGSIHSADSDINYVASQGSQVAREVITHFEAILAHPKTPHRVEYFADISGFAITGNWSSIYALGAEAYELDRELEALAGDMASALDRVQTISQLLPKIAARYSPDLTEDTHGLTVDFEAGWGASEGEDWLTLTNNAGDLADCTIRVDLSGEGGDVLSNIHFFPNWRRGSSRFARYESGGQVLQRVVGRTTLPDVESIKVTLWSPTISVEKEFLYKGAERDTNIAQYCMNLELKIAYRPRDLGILWTVERAVMITMEGVDSLPECKVSLRMTRGDKSHVWERSFAEWNLGESKTITSARDILSFDPNTVEVSLTFPGSDFEYRTSVGLDVASAP